MIVTHWLDVLDDMIQACAANERQDLADSLRARRVELSGSTVRVLVVGAPGQGKSQLINGLVNAAVCAVGDDVTTAVPAIVQHSPEPTGAFVTGSGQPLAIEGPNSGAEGRAPAPVEKVTAHANASGVVRAEVGLPRKLLETGLALVDTPPIGQAASPHTQRTLSALPQADAVLLVSDATRELTGGEVELLSQIVRLCPTVAVALTKIDLAPGWRRVADRNRARLARDGLPATVIPVSASLRLAAGRTGDAELNKESGYAELVRYLHQDLMGDVDLLRRRSAGALVHLTADQVAKPLRERLTELQNGGGTDALTARWREASKRLEDLQRESARWQTVLSDDVADLVADLEFDLRDRTRRILREADEFFEVADPAKDWEQFEEWLRENLTAVAETNSNWLLDRFEWIARKLARQMALQRHGALPETILGRPSRDHVGDLRLPAIERFGIGEKLFVGMRGSYGGLLMIGLASTFAGLPLLNPLSIGAGAAFGAKSIFEERGSRLKRRQATARTAAHRYVEDFLLTYGKESKDTVRMIHRDIRDRCTEVTHEMRAEITEAARQIKQVIDAETAEHGTRVREVSTRIERLDLLSRRGRALAPSTGVRGLTA